MGVMLLNTTSIVTGGTKNSPGAIRTAMMSRKNRIDQARGNENVVRECTRSYKSFRDKRLCLRDEDEGVVRSDTNIWDSQRRRSKLVAPPSPQEQGGDEQRGEGNAEVGGPRLGGQRVRPRRGDDQGSGGEEEGDDEEDYYANN